MHRPSLKSLVAVLVALALVSACSAEQASVPNERQPDMSGDLGQLEFTLGQAYAEAPIADGKVTFRDSSGEVIAADGAYEETTSEAGFFAIYPSGLPREFVVEVTGGTLARAEGEEPFDGTLKAGYDDYQGWDAVGVNVITSAVVDYHDAMPGSSFSDDTIAVKEHLGLGQFVETDGLHTKDLTYVVDDEVIADLADDLGGYDELIDDLAEGALSGDPSRAMRPGELPLFGLDHPLATGVWPLVTKASTALTLFNGAATALGTAYCLATESGSASSVFWGCITRTAGSSNAEVLDRLDEVSEQLEAISQQITALSVQVSGVDLANRQLNWNQLAGSLNRTYFSPIDAAFQELTCATITSYSSRDRQRCADHARLMIGRMVQNGLDLALSRDLVDQTAGQTGAIRQYADLVRQGSAGGGRWYRESVGINDAGASPSSVGTVFTWFEDYQTLLQALLLEFYSADGANEQFINRNVVFPFLGNPAFSSSPGDSPVLADPSTRAAVNCPVRNVQIANCRGFRESAYRLLPAELPAGTTIDTQTGLMWHQNVGVRSVEAGFIGQPSAYTGDDIRTSAPPRGMCPSELTNPPPTVPPPCTDTNVVRFRFNVPADQWRSFDTPAWPISYGFGDWQTPTRAQLDGLIVGAPRNNTIGPWLSRNVGFYSAAPAGSSSPNPAPGTSGNVVVFPLDASGWIWSNTFAGGTLCGDPRPRCLPGWSVMALNPANGALTWRNYSDNLQWTQRAWTAAVRTPARCEFYVDDITQRAPRDRMGC